MKTVRTAVDVYSPEAGVPAGRGGCAVVSLHSHSSCSRESLAFLPRIARQIPLVARRFERSLLHYQRLHGRPLDFSTLSWRPPLAPAEVVASEREQAARRFDLPALVSLTDHDTLEGPRALRARGDRSTPLSLEWSAPFDGSMFHLGVHGIAPSRVDEIECALAFYTSRGAGSLAELLDALNECPDTLVILNHPFWDLTGVGPLRHDATLLAFMRRHGDRLHALELNGYRTWTENRRVLSLANGFGLPLVGGGDRHGYSPNAILNLSAAASFAEFAGELRHDRVSRCVVMPEYLEPFTSRVLDSTCDILKRDARAGGRGWEDRVFVTADGIDQPVRATWPATPVWLKACVATVHALNLAAARPIFELTRADGARTLAADCVREPAGDHLSRPMTATPSAAA